ncbi:MAG: hypothetical protein SFW62_06025 [Alphaproteobacteria bacterium]|nr:hypothetical protein [Alphaproteobacteria bacterium]
MPPKLLPDCVKSMAERPGLALFCDRFLNNSFGFHAAEFNATLEHFPDAVIYTLARKINAPYDEKNFVANLPLYEKTYPAMKGRVRQLHARLDNSKPSEATHSLLSVRRGVWQKPRHAYSIFLANAILFLPLWEYLHIPFSFTLYPGGGFQMSEGRSQKGLERIFCSPMFRSVTVTMKNTLDYIRHEFSVPDEKIFYLYGGPLPVEGADKSFSLKKHYPADKLTLDICFAAHRYSAFGIDKGYDSFIVTAEKLRQKFPYLRFHVVGDYNPAIWDVRSLGDSIEFHGFLPTEELAAFYSRMDLFYSACKPGILGKGTFDGFPTGAAIEGAAAGVALGSSDPLNLNEVFSDAQDIILLKGDPSQDAAILAPYLQAPERLYALAGKGRATVLRHFSRAAQMGPRLSRLEKLIAAG